MNNQENNTNKNLIYISVMVATLIPVIIYWLTAYRSVTWWIGTSYTMSAITFGINFPPGSLILTILGWLVAQLPLGISKAFTLNLLAGIMSAAIIFLAAILTIKIFRFDQSSETTGKNELSNVFALSGIAAVLLVFSFANSVWLYSIQFNPYILTVVFTVLILLAIMHWWEHADKKGDLRWLFIIMLLFGLDFSVHRTNLLMLPGFFFWILLRRPTTLKRIKVWLIGIAGLILGLAFHLLTMPIAARDPLINANDPSNWSRFYEYVSLKQFGGSWLVNLFPRKAPFFGVQVADYIDYFKSNLINTEGTFGFFALLFPLLALLGIILLWRKNWKLCLGLFILFSCMSLGAIVYFNMPGEFYWPMDRHYMPSFIIVALFAAFAAGRILMSLWNHAGKHRLVISMIVLLPMVWIPVKQILQNYHRVNGSNKYFAYDYAHNILGTLPKNSILFIDGDNYWPLQYFNKIERVRSDVTVLSLSLTNTPWYLKQVISKNPDFPVKLSEEEISNYGPIPWQDTTIVTGIGDDAVSFNLPPAVEIPDTFSLLIKPTLAGRFVMGQDLFIINLMKENEWRRPIYFNQPPAWLTNNCRPEGLVWRLIPMDTVDLNDDILQDNLFNRYSYSGYSDPHVAVDKFSRTVAEKLYTTFMILAQHQFTKGDTAACIGTVDKMSELLPMDRINPSQELRDKIDMFKEYLVEIKK